MTSRELTSDFDFRLHSHLRMAVMHLPIKFGADIFIQCGVIDIVPKFKMAIQDSKFWSWSRPRNFWPWPRDSLASASSLGLEI